MFTATVSIGISINSFALEFAECSFYRNFSKLSLQRSTHIRMLQLSFLTEFRIHRMKHIYLLFKGIKWNGIWFSTKSKRKWSFWMFLFIFFFHNAHLTLNSIWLGFSSKINPYHQNDNDNDYDCYFLRKLKTQEEDVTFET